MDQLTLPKSAGPRERGRVHGEHFRGRIREITAIRLDLALEQGKFGSTEALIEVCRAHLPVLAAYDEALSEELLGIADGSGLTPEEIVALNHYTDLKDIPPGSQNEDEDCSAIVAGTPKDGPLLAQTWDMHGSAEPYVCLLEIPPLGDRPAVQAFTITGCLALAGLNEHGVGVTINNLKSHDAQVGIVWPALVRRLLEEDTVEAAQHVLMTAPMSSGHHYLIASAKSAVAIETSGRHKDVVFKARFDEEPDATFIHTNHCVSQSVAEVSWVSDWSTTYERYAWLEKSLAGGAIEGKDDLWKRLGSHDGHPRSLCTHLASEEKPHAMKTCGGLLMDLRARTMWAHEGCLHEVKPEVRQFA